MSRTSWRKIAIMVISLCFTAAVVIRFVILDEGKDTRNVIIKNSPKHPLSLSHSRLYYIFKLISTLCVFPVHLIKLTAIYFIKAIYNIKLRSHFFDVKIKHGMCKISYFDIPWKKNRGIIPTQLQMLSEYWISTERKSFIDCR